MLAHQLLFDALFTLLKYSTGYTCDENRNTCGFTHNMSVMVVKV